MEQAILDINEIKKRLYREKPLAIFERATKSNLWYRCTFGEKHEDGWTIYFDIPINDIEDATFERFMPAQQLIRWLITPTE